MGVAVMEGKTSTRPKTNRPADGRVAQVGLKTWGLDLSFSEATSPPTIGDTIQIDDILNDSGGGVTWNPITLVHGANGEPNRRQPLSGHLRCLELAGHGHPTVRPLTLVAIHACEALHWLLLHPFSSFYRPERNRVALRCNPSRLAASEKVVGAEAPGGAVASGLHGSTFIGGTA